MKSNTDPRNQKAIFSSQISAEDVLAAVDREALARNVLKLLKKELRIEGERLGQRGE